MDQADVEGLALELYRETRMDPCKPPPILTLARSHPRIDDVIIEPLKRPGVFELTGPQRGLIRLAAHLRPWPRRYFCAHEFGEFGLEAQRRPYRGEDRERRAHQLGAALLIPAPALRAFLRDHGFDLAAMAARFRVGQVCAFLRWAELSLLDGGVTRSPTTRSCVASCSSTSRAGATVASASSRSSTRPTSSAPA